MSGRRTPTYLLAEIQSALREGRYWMTRSAMEGASALYLDESDIRECVLGLHEADFYKSMPSVQRPGLFQDVYRCRYGGFSIYTKLQSSAARHAVIISFKRDESA
ncbi:MAG: type II toxin-antitoxin system MqsR family toxin [Longimicrobiales bacterium]